MVNPLMSYEIAMERIDRLRAEAERANGPIRDRRPRRRGWRRALRRRTVPVELQRVGMGR